jgi:ABC-type multidrug transport system fused ATPase/permease subunit
MFCCSCLCFACSVLALLSSTVTASVALHNKLLGHILRLPKSFFDTNPAGRVLNRFSKDVETMDSVLNQSISQLCNCFATYFATLIVISIATRWFGLAVVPITIVYILLQVGLTATLREWGICSICSIVLFIYSQRVQLGVWLVQLLQTSRLLHGCTALLAVTCCF